MNKEEERFWSDMGGALTDVSDAQPIDDQDFEDDLANNTNAYMYVLFRDYAAYPCRAAVLA